MYIGIADQQKKKAGKQGRDDSIKLLIKDNP